MPPLADCPVCRAPLGWTYILRPLTSRWRCRHCGSLLTIHARRRLIGISVYVPAAMSIYVAMRGAGPVGLALFAACLIALLFAVIGTIDRAVVIERCGFRCRGCGYDLRGQVTPRCPECGHEFDADERCMLETGIYPQTTRRGGVHWAIIALLILLSVLVTAGIIVSIRASARAAARARQTPATQPVATPPEPKLDVDME